MKTTVEDLREFTSEAVVHRFRETWDVPLAEAQELFDEMKRWLWLNAYAAERGDASIHLAISQSTKLIDEMWHTFILFTKEYHEFCDRYFGTYIHHVPTPKSAYDETIARYERDPDGVTSELRALFAKQYELIYDLLGQETLVKWYDNYHGQYTDERLRRIWRWSFSPYDTRVREATRADAIEAGQHRAGAAASDGR